MNENNINVEQENMEVLSKENTIQETQAPLESPKKKKKGKGVIVFLLIVAIIVGIIFGVKYFLNKSNDFEDPFPDIDYIGMSDEDYLKKYDIDNSFTYNIENDYANGVITKDQYLLQLAYSIYEPNKMDDKYKSLTNDYAIQEIYLINFLILVKTNYLKKHSFIYLVNMLQIILDGILVTVKIKLQVYLVM